MIVNSLAISWIGGNESEDGVDNECNIAKTLCIVVVIDKGVCTIDARCMQPTILQSSGDHYAFTWPLMSRQYS